MSLAGPAQQDLLWDTLVSFLYGGSRRWERKRVVARLQLGLPLLPAQAPDGEATNLYPNAHALPRLPMRAERHGVVASTDTLTLFLTNDTMLRDGEYHGRKGRPCDTCDDWEPGRRTLALHCNRKLAECLDLRRCRCLQHWWNESGTRVRVS